MENQKATKYLTLGSDIDDSKVKVSNYSKSSLSTFETCPLKAWRKVRSFKDDSTRALLVGKASHEYFAKEVSKKRNKRYKTNLFFAPDILREAKELAMNIDYDFLLKDSEMLFVEKRISVGLNNGQSLVGINDLVLYRTDEYLGDLIKIVDYKTGFKVSKEIDTEAMIYAFLAAKEYDMPIIFARISGRSQDYWEQYFSKEEALSFEPLIVDYINKVKDVLEHEESPYPTVGIHCQSCPYLGDCVAKKYDIEDIEEMIVKQSLFESQAKILKKKIKDLTFESGVGIDGVEYSTEISIKHSPKIQKEVNGKLKSVPKKELLVTLANAGLLEDVLADLDITLSSNVLDRAKDLGFSLGKNSRKDVLIQRKDLEAIS